MDFYVEAQGLQKRATTETRYKEPQKKKMSGFFQSHHLMQPYLSSVKTTIAYFIINFVTILQEAEELQKGGVLT